MTLTTPQPVDEAPRSSYLGGPDAAAILGLNPFASPWDVLAVKRGLVPGPEPSWPMRAGLALEPVVLTDYAERHPNVEVISQPGLCFHPKYPWAGGHPDGIARQAHRKWLLEVKTTQNDNHYGSPGTDQIPDHVHCQVAWYLAICDLPEADVLVLVRNRDLLSYHVERNTALEEEIFAECEEWWDRYVVRGEEPDTRDMGDRHKYIAARWREVRRPVLLPSTPAVDEIAHDLRNVRAELAKLEKREQYLADALRAYIADAEGVRTIHGDITWKRPADSKKTDWRQVALELGAGPQVIAKHTQVIENARRFVVPRSWQKEEVDDER